MVESFAVFAIVGFMVATANAGHAMRAGRPAKSAWLWAGAFLLAFIASMSTVIFVRAAAALLTPNTTAAVPVTPVASRAVMHATPEGRRMILKAWESELNNESIATRALGRTSRAHANEDTSVWLKQCEDAGVKIRLDSSALPGTVAAPTALVGDSYRDGCKAMRSFQDGRSPVAALEMVRAFSKVPAALARASENMRAEYEGLGGDPGDIRTLSQKDPAAFQR